MKDKVALITGASSGFGKAMATAFGAEGAKLVLTARNLSKLQATAEPFGNNAIAVAGDVTNPKTFERCLATAMKHWGKLDILINNAGGGVKITSIEKQTAESIAECVNLNLTSVMNACRIVVPQMKQQKNGLIINITSACQKFAWPGWSVYSATKAGVGMFSRCLYAEVRPYGVAVSVIVPGGANTGFQEAAGISNFNWDENNALQAEHIARAALSVAKMPPGAVVPEMVVYGMAQEIIPF